MATKRKKAPGGSRPLPPEKKKSKGISFKLSGSERELVDKAAELEHEKVVAWARRIVMTAAANRVEGGFSIDAAYEAARNARAQTRK